MFWCGYSVLSIESFVFKSLVILRPKNSLLFVRQADVAKMRAGYHESQTQRETFDAEAKRYKVLLITIIPSKLPFPFI